SPRALHPLPTRRSSDLRVEGGVDAARDVARLVGTAELRDVGAGREDPLPTGDHDGSRGTRGELVRDLVQSRDDRTRERVHLPVRSEEHTSELQSRENLV